MKMLTTGFLMSFFAIAGLAHAESNRFHPNHLFIKMKAGETLVESSLIKSSKKLFGDLYLVKTTSADALSNELSGSKTIEYVQKDFYAEKRIMPKHEVLTPAGSFMKNLQSTFDFSAAQFNDPEVSKLWAFTTEKGLAVNDVYANLPAQTPKEIIVAVVDTGVDHNHQDLKDVMWRNTKEIPNNGIDDDGNGYIDDIHGINTLVRDSRGNATMNTMASHWHGTHVAGTIAATQNNGIGIAGVANNVKIMAIRTVPDAADELDSDIVEAYLYAANNGAKIINCSFGKAHNEGGMVVRDTINSIERKGVLVVVSAGNDSQGSWGGWHNNDEDAKYPASFDSKNMIVIASMDSAGNLSSFSNIGKFSVDVGSPGSNIYSTINNNAYSMASGTSMAAPNASGVAAMIMGYYPRLNPQAVKKVMMDSVIKTDQLSDKVASGGRLNLKNALELAAKTKR